MICQVSDIRKVKTLRIHVGRAGVVLKTFRRSWIANEKCEVIYGKCSFKATPALPQVVLTSRESVLSIPSGSLGNTFHIQLFVVHYGFPDQLGTHSPFFCFSQEFIGRRGVMLIDMFCKVPH